MTEVTDWQDTDIRVRYCETDAGGLLHHGNYINYFEVARTELFRVRGGDYRAMESRGFYLIVVRIECSYKKPAFYDDLLTLRARITRWSGAKLEHEYEVRRGGDLIATGHSVLACVDREGTVQRITPELLYDRMLPPDRGSVAPEKS